MSFRRPYRPALSYAECREELTQCSGTQFDPRMVAAFEKVLASLYARKAAAVEAARAAGRCRRHELAAGSGAQVGADIRADRAVG